MAQIVLVGHGIHHHLRPRHRWNVRQQRVKLHGERCQLVGNLAQRLGLMTNYLGLCPGVASDTFHQAMNDIVGHPEQM